jgi:hypothetical protein
MIYAGKEKNARRQKCLANEIKNNNLNENTAHLLESC